VWRERAVFEDEFVDQLLTTLCKLFLAGFSFFCTLIKLTSLYLVEGLAWGIGP